MAAVKSLVWHLAISQTQSKITHPSPESGMAVLVSLSLKLVNSIWLYSQIQAG